MLSTHPYRNWPLHVKLFTEEAVIAWKEACQDAQAHLPLGFTYTIELEGVDGKSGKVGSGRSGPISVKDAPRGGTCTFCNTYTLWGDVIRGCYRRKVGGITPEEDDMTDHSMGMNQDQVEGELCDSDSVPGPPRSPLKKPVKQKTKSQNLVAQPRSKSTLKKGARKTDVASSSEGESFDFDVSSSDEPSTATPRKRGRPPKSSSPTATATRQKASTSPTKKGKLPQLAVASPKKRGRPRKRSESFTSVALPPAKSPGDSEPFDSDSSAGDTPRKPGRPQKASPSAIPQPSALDEPASPRNRDKGASGAAAGSSNPPLSSVTAKRARGKPKLGKKAYSTTADIASDSSGEFFDFGGVGDASSEDDAPFVLAPLKYGKDPVQSRPVIAKAHPSTAPRSGEYPEGRDDARADTGAGLARAMSSMSVSSNAPSLSLCVEVSD
ncbi:hypothetical protein DXG03_002194 [Asterophora parasitica]|uniref:Uncharacterized protein n=1 Tax=Asterophora parasitica TaxID=117018 RepID=A0A9P7GA21_9AGAR|nr:hypothetical protein DXG03_002194 [Asterophora parasitica]